MIPAQHYSPTTFLTLASINARHSDESDSPSSTAYPKPWIPDYTFDLGIPPIPPQDFQSNSMFDAQIHYDADGSLSRVAGLGIHYPDQPADEYKLGAFPPNDPQAETSDAYLPFTGSPRLDVSYSSSGLTFGDPNSSLDGSLNSSWSLSMIFAEMRHESEPASSRCSEPPHTDNSTKESGSNEDDFSLESLSAAAGLSVEEFTNRITEGAKYALEKVASATEAAAGQTLFPPVPDLPPFVGPSTLDLEDPWYPPAGGINPADIMPAPMMSAGPSLDNMYGILGPAVLPFVDPGLSFPRLPEFRYPSTPPMPIPAPDLLPVAQPSTPHASRDEGDQLSDYEPPPFLSPSSSEYSPSLGSSRQYHTRASRMKKRKTPYTNESTEVAAGATSIPGPSNIDPAAANLPPIDLGSPVFDAHRGIDIEDLKARAERYRLRNHGREYDKRWLLSYAGKLSSKGELLEEFRCYVTGCQQVNKRRDHILIHVGAHLDQRPFKCVHCSARFLRKNECKRHELSHTGIRPFTCHLCPFPATTFVRQDLLRRHMKRTHQLEDDKENVKPAATASGTGARPRKKVRKF